MPVHLRTGLRSKYCFERENSADLLLRWKIQTINSMVIHALKSIGDTVASCVVGTTDQGCVVVFPGEVRNHVLDGIQSRTADDHGHVMMYVDDRVNVVMKSTQLYLTMDGNDTICDRI